MSDVQDALSSGMGNEPAPVLVTAAEKEALGYENPEGVRNPDLQRLAMRHRAEIYGEVEPIVEEALGRDVELVGIYATYPYSAVNVTYRTVDEPIVTSDAFVGLRSDGTVSSIERIEPIEIEYRTVEGLYSMAYRQRIASMRDYLTATYPHFTQPPHGFTRFRGRVDPIFRFSNYYRSGEHENVEEVDAKQATIFQEYLRDPSRTDAEWFKLFERIYADRERTISVDLMLVDPTEELTEGMSREIAEEIRSNPLFAGFGNWIICTYGNQMLRNSNRSFMFHQAFVFTADRERPEWLVDGWLDGNTFSLGRDPLRSSRREGLRDGSVL